MQLSPLEYGVLLHLAIRYEHDRVQELAPVRENAFAHHPWREWGGVDAQSSRMPGGQSRWSAGKDLTWEPLRIERVCEVKYDHLQRDRFRHACRAIGRRDAGAAGCPASAPRQFVDPDRGSGTWRESFTCFARRGACNSPPPCNHAPRPG